MNSTSDLKEVPAPGGPTPLGQCSGPAIKRSMLYLMVHSFLLASLLLFYLRVVPLFLEVASLELGSGHSAFPPQTDFVINLSISLRANWPFFTTIAIALLCLDAILYLALHRRHGPRKANLWSRAVGWGVFVLILLSLWALCSPLFRMDAPPINPPHRN